MNNETKQACVWPSKDDLANAIRQRDELAAVLRALIDRGHKQIWFSESATWPELIAAKEILATLSTH